MTPQHFKLNSTINAIAGNVPLSNIADMQAACSVILAQIPLIISEYTEFTKAIEKKDLTEIRDGLADIIVTCDGLLSRLGITMYDFGKYKEHMTPKTPSYNMAALRLWSGELKQDVNRLKLALHRSEMGNISEVTRKHVILSAIGAINSVTGFSRIAGIDVLIDQFSVFQSNLSKFDTDASVAQATFAKYQDAGVQVVIEPCEHEGVTYHVVKSKEDQVVNGKDYPKGKFLKSVNFKEPVWLPMADTTAIDDFLQEYHS